MRQLIKFYLLFLLLLNPISSVTQQPFSVEFLPEEFKIRAFIHIVHLAGFGHRQAGTENERHTVQYIKNQFESMNVAVEIQPFEFESFEYSKLNFRIGGKSFDVLGLGIDPYKNKREYEGTALLIDLADPAINDTLKQLEGKAIISDNWDAHFRLVRFKPELIIYVDSQNFAELETQDELKFTLNIEGECTKYKSANIIGRIGNGSSLSKEILITAHFDTYRRNNPGASDNASGVAVMLELARCFKRIESELDCIVKFVAFGAEEVGVVGSRNYLDSNAGALQNCELLFNIDDVGGSGPILVELDGGVNGIPDKKCVSQIPERIKCCSWEGVNSRWRMLADDDLMKIMAASNHPEWLGDVVKKSVENLGYEIQTTGTQGSDQIAFAQAGIVTSGVGIISRYRHTSQDVPGKINERSLQMAGEMAARVVLNTLKRFGDRYQ